MEPVVTKRKSSAGSFRRRSYGKRHVDSENPLKKDNFSDTEAGDVKINYQDEMVLVLFNSMLEIIVNEWKPIPIERGPPCVCKQPTIGEIKEGSIASDTEGIENVSQESKLSAKRDSTGSSRSAKSVRKESIKRKYSKISDKSKPPVFLDSDVSKMRIKKSTKVSRESTTGIYVTDCMIYPQNETVKIILKNGDQYEGSILRKLMHGHGKYTWADGTVYEGDFEYGFCTGHGILCYPDLTTYHGEFCKSILHGYGDLNISSTTMRYCGYWKNSQKHGKGWMLYQPEDWYDGEWYEDHRHGKGLRNYKTGEKYQGDWDKGLQHGNGTFIWTNNDVYIGEWKEGKMHGYGEYTWNAFLNQTFTYPTQNIYKGNWVHGLRHGTGILDFGFDSGARLAAIFCNNEKHGAGILVCGNGTVIQQSKLFWNDKLVNFFNEFNTHGLKNANSNDLQKLNEISSTAYIRTESSSEHKSFLRLKLESNKTMDTTHKGTQCSINSTDSNSLRMLIHTPPEDTNFSHYIDLAVLEYTTILFKEQLNVFDLKIKTSHMHAVTAEHSTSSKHNKHHFNTDGQTFVSPSDYHSLLTMHQLQQEAVEKKNLKDTIITHLPRLYKLYEKYATITIHQKIKFKPILIRYFLWQFVRDLKFFDTRNSLIDFDLIIFENPNSGLEFVHAPFEKIYFWQFLQILVCLTWKFHSANTVTDECKTYGILSTLLSHFLTEMVYANPKITNSYSLFEFRDLLPITNVYELYKQVGEPHTVRTFLNRVCVKKHEHPHCYLNSWNESNVQMRAKGINIVPVNGNVIYLEDDTLRIGEPPIPNEIESTDPFKTQLFALRALGPKRVAQCLISICPHITVNGIIINMEYPLAFIEFYDTILMSTFMLVDRKRKRMERIRLQQDLKLQISLKEIDAETCSSKYRRSSTRVKKPGKK